MMARLDALHAAMDLVLAETQPAIDADKARCRALDLERLRERAAKRLVA
jgi:hypothetical protein